MDVAVVPVVGTCQEIHDLDHGADGVLTSAAVWRCQPTDTCLVLGSRQQSASLEQARLRSSGVGVARRRSGGGAVLISPGHVVWIDLVLPRGGVAEDVRESMLWAGHLWRDGLEVFGVDAGEVHQGPVVSDGWGTVVCFAGRGPGELMRGRNKLVGLSQRRTRAGIRVQGMLHVSDVPPTRAEWFRNRPSEENFFPISAASPHSAPVLAELLSDWFAASIARQLG